MNRFGDDFAPQIPFHPSFILFFCLFFFVYLVFLAAELEKLNTLWPEYLAAISGHVQYVLSGGAIPGLKGETTRPTC